MSIEFQDPPDAVTAKEEFSLEVLVLNEFKDPIDAEVELLLDGNVLANQSVSLLGGENRLLSFDSLLMEVAGTRNFQAESLCRMAIQTPQITPTFSSSLSVLRIFSLCCIFPIEWELFIPF